MSVQSLIITNLSGNILYKKYYPYEYIGNDIKKTNFEYLLFKLTSYHTKNNNTLYTIYIEDISVIYQIIGEFIIYIGGIKEIDQIICKDR